VNALLRPQAQNLDSEDETGTTEDWEGLPSPEPPPIDHESEYIDEDKYTTVTVEAMDVTKEGLIKADAEEQKHDKQPDDVVESTKNVQPGQKTPQGKRKWTKEKPKDKPDKPKPKRKKFRYETKTERKFTKMKQREKNSKQAKARREAT